MPGQHEHVVTVETVHPLLKTMDCTENGISLGFRDNQSFMMAQDAWGWVNTHSNNHLYFIVGKGDCSYNDHRIPYNITSLDYDAESFNVHLSGRNGTWESMVSNFDMKIARAPMPEHMRLQKRNELDKDIIYNINGSLPFRTRLRLDPFYGDFICYPCLIQGKLHLEMHFKSEDKKPKMAKIRLTPQNLTAHWNITLGAGTDWMLEWGDMEDKLMLKLPLGGIFVPPIVEVGPLIEMGVQYEYSPFETLFTVLTGFVATVPNTAMVEIDLLNPKNNKFSSWAPKFQAYNDTYVQARLSTNLKIFTMAAIRFRVSVLSKF